MDRYEERRLDGRRTCVTRRKQSLSELFYNGHFVREGGEQEEEEEVVEEEEVIVPIRMYR